METSVIRYDYYRLKISSFLGNFRVQSDVLSPEAKLRTRVSHKHFPTTAMQKILNDKF